MAGNEEGEKTISHGNEWEVVSLTASAYAAAPGPKPVEIDEDNNNNTIGEDEAQTSHAMIMSGHFVFPPNHLENLPSEPEIVKDLEILNMQGVQEVEDVPVLTSEKDAKLDKKDEENWNIKGLTLPDEHPGIQFFDEKASGLSIQDTEFDGGPVLEGLSLVEKEQSVYNAAKFGSFHETAMDRSTSYDEDIVIPEFNESDQGLGLDNSEFPMQIKEEKKDGSDPPCEAWWKRRAVSLCAIAKEANTLWSIFIAAAVMGVVILGQKWQQERWQVLQLKWQFSINDEKMTRMLSPISRLKDVIDGGNRHGSSIRGGSTTKH